MKILIVQTAGQSAFLCRTASESQHQQKGLKFARVALIKSYHEAVQIQGIPKEKSLWEDEGPSPLWKLSLRLSDEAIGAG